MRLSRHAPVALLFTTVAVLSLQPGAVPIAQAEKFRFFSSRSSSPSGEEAPPPAAKDGRNDNKSNSCPFYGCPLHPVDVHYNSDEIKKALEELRSDKRLKVAESDAARRLSTSTTDQHVTLTLIGYKGGTLESQINQDR